MHQARTAALQVEMLMSKFETGDTVDSRLVRQRKLGRTAAEAPARCFRALWRENAEIGRIFGIRLFLIFAMSSSAASCGSADAGPWQP
eukprot:scaffold876_cov243-Pinguiococcus_pyrenoidosus.AAC.22